ALEKYDVPRIDLADIRDDSPEHGIDAVPACLVVGTDIPGIIADLVVRTRFVEDVVSGDHCAVRITTRELLPKSNITILVGRDGPKETDARCVVRMPMDVLPAL